MIWGISELMQRRLWVWFPAKAWGQFQPSGSVRFGEVVLELRLASTVTL